MSEDFYEDDDTSTVSKKVQPPMDPEECRKYGVFCIKESSRKSAWQHRKAVDANIAKRNHRARIEKTERDNRILRERNEEDERLYRLSCARMANSALHTDQYKKEVERTARLGEMYELQRLRKKRADIVRGSKKATPKPIPLKGEVAYVGSNPVADVVVLKRVICQMALNHKIISDQLHATKVHNKALSKLIRREVEDTKKMFPALLAHHAFEMGGQVSTVRPSSATAECSPHRTFQLMSLDPLSAGKENNNSSNNNNAHWNMRNLDSPGIRRPQSSPLVRQQRPTSPILRWLKQSETEKVSIRFDSPVVPLTGTRPELPKIITIPDVLPGWIPPPTHLY